MKRKIIFTLFFVFGTIVFAQSKPDSNTIFNYYIACATEDVNTAKKFLSQYPNYVDIELTVDNYSSDFDKEISSTLAYQRFASYLISKGIVSGFENKEEEKEFVKKYKRYPIIIASQYGNLEIVKLLISYHANLELKDEKEKTALIRASQNGHLDIIKELVNNGANIEAHQGSILTTAVCNGQKKVIEYFLKKGVNVDSEDSYGCTSLIYASVCGHSEIASLLLKNNADVNAKTNDGITALILASENGYISIVKELLKHKVDVNAEWSNGVTALIAAATNGHSEIVSLLLKNNADVNVKTNEDRTAMNYAILNGQTEIVKLLMEYDADLLGDICAIYIDIVTALLKHHSDIACMILKDDKYRRMFFNTSMASTVSMKIRPDGDEYDMTLLMYASREGFVDFVKLLIENNLDVNESNTDGETALMYAAINGRLEIVNILIDAGADINARNSKGISVLQYAAYAAKESNDTSVFDRLYYLGATFDK